MKSIELTKQIMTITKKSIKIVNKSLNFKGTNENLCHFKQNSFYPLKNNLIDFEKIKEKREKYKNDYHVRRQQKLVELSECNDFRTMITITFAPEDNKSMEQVKDNWSKIRKRIKNYYGDFKYIIAIERGETTGHLHLHVITDFDYLDNNSKYYQDRENFKYDSMKVFEVVQNTSNRAKELKEKRTKIYNEGGSELKTVIAFGNVHVKEINDKIVNYITKYVSKGYVLNKSKDSLHVNDEINSEELRKSFMEKYKRTVWTSRNLEKPVKIYSSDTIDYLLSLIPNHEFEYQETSFILYDVELLNVERYIYQKKIDDFYYMSKLAYIGNEQYIIEQNILKEKSYKTYFMNVNKQYILDDYEYNYKKYNRGYYNE